MMKTKRRVRTHSQYDLNNDLAKIKAILSDTAYDARGKVGEVWSTSLENAKDKTLALKENVENYALEKPLKSIGITFLAGLLVGYFIHK